MDSGENNAIGGNRAINPGSDDVHNVLTADWNISDEPLVYVLPVS
jgi:hypothetical protein